MFSLVVYTLNIQYTLYSPSNFESKNVLFFFKLKKIKLILKHMPGFSLNLEMGRAHSVTPVFYRAVIYWFILCHTDRGRLSVQSALWFLQRSTGRCSMQSSSGHRDNASVRAAERETIPYSLVAHPKSTTAFKKTKEVTSCSLNSSQFNCLLNF